MSFSQGDIDGALLDIGHADIVNADDGHGARSHLLVGCPAGQGEAVAHPDAHRGRQALPDKDIILVGSGQVAPSRYFLTDQADDLLLFRFSSNDGDGKGALPAGGQSSGHNPS